jgi:DNA-binding transcriptional MerR regulator
VLLARSFHHRAAQHLPGSTGQHHALTLKLSSRFTLALVDGLRVSELAERAGVAPSAVRFYERAGLLSPARRAANGYRVFDESALDELAFISRAKGIGMTLEDIADLVASWPVGECRSLQARLRAYLAGRIDQVRRGRAGAAAVGHRPRGNRRREQDSPSAGPLPPLPGRKAGRRPDHHHHRLRRQTPDHPDPRGRPAGRSVPHHRPYMPPGQGPALAPREHPATPTSATTEPSCWPIPHWAATPPASRPRRRRVSPGARKCASKYNPMSWCELTSISS